MRILLLAAIFAFAASLQAGTPPAKTVTEQEVVQIAKEQLVAARPDLKVNDRTPYGDFVAAGPTSGGGPKWVIGFSVIERKSGKKGVYYVTVFPGGRTSKDEIRAGADS